MSWSSCWNSVGCLESWKESLTSLRTWSGLLAGGITLFVAIMTLVLWKFDSRISVLAAPRHLTESQKKTLLENLNGVSEASVYFLAYSTSDESQAYAGELKAIFGEAGWQTHGPVLFYVEGEPLPQGIIVLVKNNQQIANKEKRVIDALKAAGLEMVSHSATETGDHNLTGSVGIRIGVRPRM